MPTGGSRSRYSAYLRQLIENCISSNIPPLDICRHFHVSHQWVYDLRLNFECFGTVSPPSINAIGRPRKIDPEAIEGIKDFLDEYPLAFQDDIVQFLYDEYNILCHKATVSRLLKNIKYTRKRTERVHSEQDEVLRANFRARMCQYTASQIIVVDESAVNERTADRRYGWSPAGMPCRVRLVGGRSRRWSVLPAIGINGYLDWDIYHGSFNTERFNDFIRHLLTKMNPFPGPRSVLVMDNHICHLSPELKAMCLAAGVVLEYLPPYSPDYSPIEQSFNRMKQWIKRNKELADEFGEWYEGFFTMAIMNTVTPAQARRYFQDALISVDESDNDIDYNTLRD